MCDPMDEMNKSFDVEAQQSLLQDAETEVIEAEQVVDEADEKERERSGRQALQRIFLLIRCTQLFKLAANYHSGGNVTSSISSTSTSADYTAICSHLQDSGIVPDLENSAESAQDTSSTAHSASQLEEQYNNIDPQRVQRENIAEIVKKKNLHDPNNRLGGVRGVAEALNSDLCNGISIPQTNIYHPNSSYSTQLLSQYLIIFYHSFLGACKNPTIFLLFFAAILSLTFGIKEQGLNINGWFDGAVVILTIFVLVIFATVHNFFEEMKSQRKLENSWQLKGGKMEVLVVREGVSFFVSVIDLRVGDLVVLRKGDQVPADGVFAGGQAIELDDSTTIKPAIIDDNNPFLFYGSRVINGNGRMIVTAMGMDTVWGEMMSQCTDKKCTVEACLHKLNTCIQIVGLSISILIIIVLFLRYKEGKLDDENGYKTDNKGEPTQVKTILDAIKGIITSSKGTARVLTTLLSISLLGVMDGLPFAISVAIIIWNRKTLACKASERDYLACVKMASVTTICTDKFGGLTEHEKVVDRFIVGKELVCESSVVASNVLEDICDGIGSLFLLSSNECESKVLPLYPWAETKLGMKKGSVRERCKMISSNGCNPYQECCRAVIEKTGNEGQKKYLLHLIGPPQHILAMCSKYCDIKGDIQTIDDDKRMMFDQVTQHMLSEAEVIGYACVNDEYDVASIEDDHDLGSFTFLGMVGLKDAKMEDTKKAISTLMEGGIRTILTSGDDVSILQTIGQNRGLLVSDSDDLVLTGEEFRSWSDEERKNKLHRIRIIGNCLPSDKILLIRCLKEKGEVVALLGQQTIDAPALRLADIGLTFGTWSSEVARESCDISIWDGDFNFLINIIENGRCFQENIRKFVQLELIVTISSSLINFTATLLLGDAPITVIKLFWLNLVVALVGGLALLTGPSTESLKAEA